MRVRWGAAYNQTHHSEHRLQTPTKNKMMEEQVDVEYISPMDTSGNTTSDTHGHRSTAKEPTGVPNSN